jgi:hypothetical protein
VKEQGISRGMVDINAFAPFNLFGSAAKENGNAGTKKLSCYDH